MLNGLKPPKKRDGEYTFWPAIQLVLTDEGNSKHKMPPESFVPLVSRCIFPLDSQALSYLANINTDSGRGRAWIRWALNERSLEMYLTKLTGARVALSQMYHDLAFLLDEEKMSMLSGLAQGIESVVFALDVDVVSLNPLFIACIV